MSVVIIGGHERMENRYKEICKKYNHKSKVFTKMRTDLSRQIGTPDLMILFTATASHKMVRCAVAESERGNVALERSHSSSASALIHILEAYV
ncbi:DUF2325 domain-containing protein [Lachnospiraceae bacterium]|nr:DUF2325 domain-containing protein [Lachnospiraceae bacterium]